MAKKTFPLSYIEHLSTDKKLRQLLLDSDPLTLKKRKNIWLYLCASIMSQQLSVKVADIIYQRFIALYGGDPEAEQVAATDSQILRSIGLSNAKVSYVKNVAQFEIDYGMEFKKLQKLSNEEVIEYLIQIKGVGRWTVEMLLMFALGREDVFAPDDLGIQNAMIRLYQLDRTDKKLFRENLLRISAKWAPFRTYACLHLWRSKDNAPVILKKAKERIN